MIEPLTYGFFQRALLAGVFAGAICGLLSVFVVIKRMAFIGQGISHAAFGGVALGLLLGITPRIPAAIFAVAMALGVSFISRRKAIPRDALIGILLALSMALGIVFLSMSAGYTGSIISYLFGNILMVTRTDLLVLLIVTILGGLYVILFFKELQFYVFDESIAGVYGVPVFPIQIGLMVCIALAVIASVQVVGIILVTAMLVIPGTVALFIGRSYIGLFVISIIVGVLSSIAGLFLSYYLNIPSGATIVIVLSIIFFVIGILKSSKE